MTGRPAGRGQVPGPLEVVGLRMPAFGRALKDAASFLLLFFSVTRARKLRRVFVLAVGGRGLKYHVKSMLGSGGNFLAHRRDEFPGAEEMLARGIIGHAASFNASPRRSKVRPGRREVRCGGGGLAAKAGRIRGGRARLRERLLVHIIR